MTAIFATMMKAPLPYVPWLQILRIYKIDVFVLYLLMDKLEEIVAKVDIYKLYPNTANGKQRYNDLFVARLARSLQKKYKRFFLCCCELFLGSFHTTSLCLQLSDLFLFVILRKSIDPSI